MRINCLGCGHLFDLGPDYDDYKGWVKCGVCRTLNNIETENGKIKSVEPESLEKLCRAINKG